MRIGRQNIHLHAIASHFTNALYPLASVFLCLFLVYRNNAFKTTYLHLMISASLSVPLTYVTGIVEWKKTYKGAKVRIFSRKIVYGLALWGLGAFSTAWLLVQPAVLEVFDWHLIILVTVNFMILYCVVYLGYLGGRLVFGGGAH